MPLPSPPSSSPTPTSLPFSSMPPSPTTTTQHCTTSHPTPLDLLCSLSQPEVSSRNGLPAHLSLPTQPIPQHCLPSEALTLPHPPPRLADMVCNIADFSNTMAAEGNSLDGNNIHPSPSTTPQSPLGQAASPEAIASSAIAELTELTELEAAPAWAAAWEPEHQDILSSAMAALSDMLDSPDCNGLEYNNCNFPNNVPTASPSFGFSHSPALENFHNSSSPSYSFSNQLDSSCYGMKTESGMYGLKTEVCYGVKTETESYGSSPKQQLSYEGLNVKETYGLSPTSVLDYGSPPSSPSSADGWPMGE